MCASPANDTGFFDPGEAKPKKCAYLSHFSRPSDCTVPVKHSGTLLPKDSKQEGTDKQLQTSPDIQILHAGALNYVKVTGLQPSTRYYYIYGDLVRCCLHYSLLDTLPFALCSDFGVLPSPAWCSLTAVPRIYEGASTVSYSDKVSSWPPQKRGMGSELTFMTSPAPGPSGTLKLLAIADHGHAEVIAANG